MAAQLRESERTGGTSIQNQGIGTALKDGLAGEDASASGEAGSEKAELVLTNRAGESRSPYVRAHKDNPVKWQLWGDEAIEMARRENRLLFLSVGYAACHWCHVMERESFENEEVASILNSAFIPIKIDREERPDIDRIYMNFVQATSGSGGWPLNVFITPDLEPVFGGTYWPGPTSQTPYEDQVDFLGILNKLSTVWREQEQRCRSDSKQILEQLKSFAAEGTFGDRLGEGGDGLDIELLEEANQYFASTFDSQNGGFGSAPKFPTPSKLSFLLRLGQYPPVVIDVVGAADCRNAQSMAITSLKKMARGGIHDHVGNGFARYSVTADWSLPHFEKMLYDNAQLLHVYLDAFLLSRDAELLGVVYDISTYLTTDLAHPAGGFYSSEDADSLYRKGDTEKREGAFYVWTKREFENVLGSQTEPILSAFFNVSGHGNVKPENDAHDEFLDQNVLAIVSTPSALASQFGMKEEEVVRIIKEGKQALLSHRERERVRPTLDDKIVVSWNGIAIGALARTGAVVKGFDPIKAEEYLRFAIEAATFIKENLYDESSKILYRIWREGRGETEGFADDYAFLIEGLLDLYEATFNETWLQWADELQQTQISLFYDTQTTSGFFSTPDSAPHIILRLKDGMDTSEPSTNGTSASNLYRLSSLLNDNEYADKAKSTIAGFESEALQYPWLFASFMPSVVAGQFGVRGVVVAGGVDGVDGERVEEFEKSSRGGLSTFAWLKEDGGWLRSRNRLLRDFAGRDGEARVMVCEGGVCIEEGVLGGEREVVVAGTAADASRAAVGKIEEKKVDKEIDVSEYKAALPSLGDVELLQDYEKENELLHDDGEQKAKRGPPSAPPTTSS
ncbi:related to DUF255 domain protein [Rhynchosporium graminicola]|uniref:Related to DUF255 domain protein n=1 Tax=Rhynchosporium graminicola TaxID=2792576 RepID=A0A1E1KJ51_9HELO|nr:related to DUF255 domain protein [Rhynchosporium commune]